jgi:hypothetical protein
MVNKFPVLLSTVLILALLLSACAAPEGPAETPEAPGVIPETGDPGKSMPSRLSPIIGADVVDDEGQPAGHVIDIILNPFGLPEYLIVSSEEQYIPAPYTAFLWDEEQERVVFGLDRELLEGAPSFPSLEEFPALDIAGWDQHIDAYWIEHVDVTGAPEQAPVDWDVPRRVNLALESPVINFEGEQIAEVEEILYSQTEERGFVVIQRDGQLFPVPWEEFDWDQVNARLIYLYEMERLENAPQYDSLDELNTTQTGWDEEISAYWRMP